MSSFSSSRLKRIDDWMASYVEAGKYPGASFLLAEGGRIVHRARTGKRALDAGLPFEDDTIVRIYSMTKPIVSAAMMMLVERGLIHLGAPVSSVLPEFSDMRALLPGAGDISQSEPCPAPTIHQLLTHTSGLTYGFNPGPLGRAYTEGKVDFAPMRESLADVTRRLAALPLAFQPGARWEYSVGIDVIGRVIEAVTGEALDVWLQREMFDPLGMKDTGFHISKKKAKRLAHLYTSIESGEAISLTASGKIIMREVDTAAESAWLSTKTFSGGGGLLSTLDDFFAFTEMLRKGGRHNGARLLSPSTIRFMRRNHLGSDIASMGPTSFAETPTTGVGFGIGGSVVLDPGRSGAPSSPGDYSWGGIASTFFWMDPELDMTAIFFTQLTPSSAYPSRPQLKALVHGARK